ncbi:WD40 repeat-like protein [Phlegmacium glaucopus]|nr:WD40 repeat-like protein [Phlegmacium glaucopus]
MHIVSISGDLTARIWNTTTGECEAELKGHSGPINSAVFSPDGLHIVSASSDHTTRIWNTATGRCEMELKEHSKRVISAVFSPDGMHIVSAFSDHTVRVWDRVTGKFGAVLKGHNFIPSLTNNTQSLAVSSLPNGVFMYNGSDGHIHLSLQSSSLDIIGDIIFHTKTLQRIWIPPLFHKPKCISHHLSKICLGYGSGEVLVLEYLD